MIIFSIHNNKVLIAKKLAEHINVTPGAVTQFVDPLVKMNIIKRDEDTKDRRTILLKLTEKGNKGFNNFRKSFYQSTNFLFENLSEAELYTLDTLLGKVKYNAKKRRDL